MLGGGLSMKEFGAKLVLKDSMSSALKRSAKQQQDFTKQINNTKKAVQGLDKAKANPKINVDSKNKATQKLNQIKQKLAQMKSQAVAPVVKLKDQVTSKVANVKAKLKGIATNFTPIVKLRDMASQGLAKVKNTLGGLASKAHTIMLKVKDGATKVLGKVGSMLKSLAKGVTIGLGIAGAGAIAGIGKSLSEGANLQQSMGGVETLFKDDASTVIENANKAFQTAGLSANEYMENVTSFSASLLASLGGDTKKSAQVADMAMIDMADNANKFGTDMESIQTAYQGFAKQNYTMLDNLKLGYGGTKSEMERLLSDAQKLTGVKYDINNLSDVYNAIHAVQENLGVTGTTAKEASVTFSGSLASMKASFTNLMGKLSVGDGEGVARSMGDLVNTASTFLFKNLVPMVQTVISNLPSAIGSAMKNVAPMVKENVLPLVNSIKDGIFDGLNNIGIDTGAIQAILDQLFNVDVGGGGIMEIFSSLKDSVVKAINAILPLIPPIISVIQALIPVVLEVVNTIIDTVSQLAPMLVPVIDVIKGVILQLIPVIQQILPVVMQVVTTIGQIIATVMPVVGQIVSTVIVALMPLIESIMQVVQSALPVIMMIVTQLAGVIQTLVPVIGQIIETIVPPVQQIILALIPVIEMIGNVVTTLMPVISVAVQAVGQVIGAVLPVIGTIFQTVANIITTVVNTIVKVVQSLSTSLAPIFNTIKTLIQGLADAFSSIFGGIGDVVSSVCGGITSVISGVVDKIGGAISKVGEFAGKIGGSVASALGFAYGKDRVPYNNYPAMLHEGEKVLTRNEADQYDRVMSTRGVPSRAMGTGVIQRDNTLINAHEGEKLLTKQEAKQAKSGGINIAKLADSIVVREEADIEKITNSLVKRLEKVATNMA